MSERSYDQYCGIAYALDIIGERWTLLIIRELLLGPRRFKDLQEGLPGIGSNLLSDRLKKLQEYEIIRQRELPPPAASTVYELTDTGSELSPVIESLASWGSRFLDSPGDNETFSPRWLLLALKTKFVAENARETDSIVEFRIDDEILHAHVRDGTIETRQGAHPDADLTITAGRNRFLELAMEGFQPNDPEENNGITIEGDRGLLDRMGSWFDVQDT